MNHANAIVTTKEIVGTIVSGQRVAAGA